MVAIDTERLIGEKQKNKPSAEGARLLKEAMLLRDFQIYKAIPRRVLSLPSRACQGLRDPPNSINVGFYKTN